MPRFPRLDLLHSRPVEQWSEADLAAAVRAGTREDADLDWKQAPYAKYDGMAEELGKDVAALANAGGGVLAIGVKDSGGRAAELTPFELTAMPGAEARIQGTVADKVAPIPLGITFRRIEAATSGLGYLLVLIPRSLDTPHAVRIDRSLGYPTRDADRTRWMHEAEVARRYRDRHAARADRATRLDSIHTEALRDTVQSDRVLLSMTLVPDVPGLAAVGQRGVEDLRTWADERPWFPCPLALDYNAVRVGLRKVVASTRLTDLSQADEGHVELHEDGSGTAVVDLSGGLVLGKPRIRGDFSNTASALLRDVEAAVIGQLDLLTLHATQRARCSGDAIIRLDMTVTDTWVLTLAEPTPISGEDRRAAGARVLRKPWPHVLGGVSLDAISSSRRELLRAAHLLAADLLSVFGVGPEHLAVDRDGNLNAGRFGRESRPVADWVSRVALPTS